VSFALMAYTAGVKQSFLMVQAMIRVGELSCLNGGAEVKCVKRKKQDLILEQEINNGQATKQ